MIKPRFEKIYDSEAFPIVTNTTEPKICRGHQKIFIFLKITQPPLQLAYFQSLLEWEAECLILFVNLCYNTLLDMLVRRKEEEKKREPNAGHALTDHV